jgi:glycosyltransferase involved in cell wall biosynthesis
MGLTVHDAFYFQSDPNLARNLRDADRLSHLIEEGRFELIHAHGSWDHVLAALARRRGPAGAPLIRTDHGAREFSGSLVERFQFGRRMTDNLVVLSDRLRARAVERLGRQPGSVTVIRGAVDVAAFHPLEAPAGKREELGVSADDVVVGIVARVQRHRRFEVLLEAALRVRKRAPHVKIIVLGRGTHKEEILDRPVAEMRLSGCVIPLGYRRADYRDVLATLDAGLMLVPGSDGSCRAAMQMAALGKPLVVAQRGVLPDIVRDGETGIVTRDTPKDLAEALMEMAESDEQRAKWGRAGRERMKEHFSLAGQAERMLDLYRRVAR